MRFERLINQTAQGQVDSLALGPESIAAHHLINEAVVELHVGAHAYTTIHHVPDLHLRW